MKALLIVALLLWYSLTSLRAVAGECRIIAVGSSEAHEDGADVPAVMLRYYGRENIPLGSCRPDPSYEETPEGLRDPSKFARDLAADTFNYGHTRRGRQGYPDTVQVYVQALHALPHGAKARLIVVGAHSNLRSLLENHRDVVVERISELHFMGGRFYPENGEESETVWTDGWNLKSAPFDVKYVAENWPAAIPVYINPDHLAWQVRSTLFSTRQQLSYLHPARRVFELYFHQGLPGRGAFDKMSVVSAVRRFTNLNSVDLTLRRGTLEINSDGLQRFISSPDGPHFSIHRPMDSATADTLVIIDNASPHTSAKFTATVEIWEERGLFFYFLPPYCPELNLIELL